MPSLPPSAIGPSTCATSPPSAGVSRNARQLPASTAVNRWNSLSTRKATPIPCRSRDRVERRLEQIRDALPEDLEIIKIYDQSNFISAAIQQVSSAALFGGILAIMVLYGFLRDSRATAIIAVAIPVSVVGTFLLMYTNAVSLNIMSLGGVALAVGMLVDNAIVVLENIVRKKRRRP